MSKTMKKEDWMGEHAIRHNVDPSTGICAYDGCRTVLQRHNSSGVCSDHLHKHGCKCITCNRLGTDRPNPRIKKPSTPLCDIKDMSEMVQEAYFALDGKMTSLDIAEIIGKPSSYITGYLSTLSTKCLVRRVGRVPERGNATLWEKVPVDEG